MAMGRKMAFSGAVYKGPCTVEGITAILTPRPEEIAPLWDAGCIPVVVDPQDVAVPCLHPEVIIGAAPAERDVGVGIVDTPFVISAGPGFIVGENVHRVTETNRGHNLGQVLYSDSAKPDTGISGGVIGVTTEHVLRTPQTGIFFSRRDIEDHVKAGDIVATVEANGVSKGTRAVISGVIRGLLRSGASATDWIEVGDVDPRDNTICHHVSDKAFTIGGGILEAILGRFNRPYCIRRGILHCPVGKNVPTA